MVALVSPGGLVVRVHAQPMPDVFAPSVAVLDGDGTWNPQEPMFHEGLNLLGVDSLECLLFEQFFDGGSRRSHVC